MELITHDSIDFHLSSLSENGYSENTIRAYRADLIGWMEWILEKMPEKPEGWTVTLDGWARAYITTIRKELKPKTVTRKITAIRGYGLSVGEPLLSGYRAPTPMRATPHPIAEGLDGVMRMVAVATTPQQVAVIVLGGLVGLRLSESRSVEPYDFDVDNMTLRVRGKGDKERLVPVSKAAWELLAPAVMDAMMRQGKLVPYSDRRARQVVTNCARRAGLSARVASHDLRATFATEAYERTLDLRVVQELLGHASSVTTEGYVMASRRRMREAVGD